MRSFRTDELPTIEPFDASFFITVKIWSDPGIRQPFMFGRFFYKSGDRQFHTDPRHVVEHFSISTGALFMIVYITGLMRLTGRSFVNENRI